MKQFIKTGRRFLSVLWYPGFLFLFFFANFFMLAGAALFYHFEGGLNPQLAGGFFSAVWWAIATITTVGYGDVVPLTTGGRAIGVILMYTGTALFVAFISVVMNRVSEIEKGIVLEEREQERMETRLQQIAERLEKIEQKL